MRSCSGKLVVPAAGRPFKLGQLYDQRSEEVVVGPALWDEARLAKFDTLDNCRSSNMDVRVHLIIGS